MVKLTVAAAIGVLLLSTTTFAQTNTRSTSTSQSGATAIAIAPSATSGSGGSGNGTYPASAPTAPSIVVGSPCMGAVSGAGTSPMLGIAIGMSYKDKECEARANAGALFALGQPAAAMQVMCQVDSIRQAMAKAGRPCDGFVVSGEPVAIVTKASVVAPPLEEYRHDYCYTASPGERAQHRECAKGK